MSGLPHFWLTSYVNSPLIRAALMLGRIKTDYIWACPKICNLPFILCSCGEFLFINYYIWTNAAKQLYHSTSLASQSCLGQYRHLAHSCVVGCKENGGNSNGDSLTVQGLSIMCLFVVFMWSPEIVMKREGLT